MYVNCKWHQIITILPNYNFRLLKGVSPKVGPPSSSLTPPPPIPPPLTSVANSGPASSLELLLVERAKALQQANPALKAFADMQGKGLLIYILLYISERLPWLFFVMFRKSPFFIGHLGTLLLCLDKWKWNHNFCLLLTYSLGTKGLNKLFCME